MISTAILSTTYFGPIQWYQKLSRYNSCLVEKHENFVRQTYRNRCTIATAQGLQNLSVPVEVDSDVPLTKTAVKDVRISDHGNWVTYIGTPCSRPTERVLFSTIMPMT